MSQTEIDPEKEWPSCPSPTTCFPRLSKAPRACTTTPARHRALRLLAPGVEPVREPGDRADVDAAVVVLHAPRSVAPPLRLTRRGVAVLALAVAALAVALVWAAAASAPSSGSASAGTAGAGASSVTVRSGDTLWSIATRVAPDKDPRAEVDLLRRANHLAGVSLVPGQVLALR